MKKLLLISAILFIIGSMVSYIYAQRNSNFGHYTTEPECLGIEFDGSVTLRSWGTGRNRIDAVNQAKKNAVYYVIFKGINKGDPNCNPRPLLSEINSEIKYEDFFNLFFSDKNGDYKKFCSAKKERLRNKIFRKGMRDSKRVTYSVVVNVNRSNLKEKLQHNGLIKN